MAKQGPHPDEDYQALIVLLKALQLRDENVAGQVLTLKPQLRQKSLNQTQTTALIGAIKYSCSTEIFRELIKAPSAINAQDTEGWAAIHLTVRYNRCDLLSILLEQKEVNLDIRTAKGESALMLAADQGDSEMVAMLLEQGADYLLEDLFEQGKRLPIHMACLAGSFACVNALLKKDPSLLEAKDGLGRTPAHYLAQSKSSNLDDKKAIAALFLGTQLAQECNDDVTPEEMARYFKHDAVADVMASKQILSLYQICQNELCRRYEKNSFKEVLEVLPEYLAENLQKKKGRMTVCHPSLL